MTTVVLRPDGTDVTGSISVTGAATAHAALNDSSDASYVTATSSLSTTILSVGTAVLPAGAITKTATLTVRDDGVTNASAYLAITGGTTVVSGYGSLTLANSSHTAAVDLSQAQIDALQFLVYFFDSGSIAYDAYLTLVYATQPVTAVLTPTGVQALSSVAISWTHTPGSDGGAQTRYQARIFSAAEYGVSGFTPGSSPATWDSGEVASSAFSTTSGALANSTTYRCYIRTAQTINGSPHWAEWAFSSFTTSFTTANITSVTVTGDSTLARHRITIARDTGTANWLTFDLQRSDDAGTTWVAVRGATGATPPGDVWIGYDYEGTNGVAAIYRARANTATITGPWTTSTGATWTSTDHWLKDLRSPGNNVTVEISTMPQRQYGIEQVVYRVLGRADPVVVSDVRQYHTASITFEVYSAAEADNLRDLLSSGTVLLQIGTGLGYDSIYLVAGTIIDHHAAEQIGTEWRYVEVNYTAVGIPPDDGVDSTGLTWGDINSSYATWQLLLDTGDTWGDLV